ncbi:protein APEM9-like isoform X2 [Vigna unguiculata]|uniref:protein APEM9-like isoform X2 n=1 Tax=Vigna unguiculata TaxID=3917 RepID=UPI001016A851|nr:protein APEM9-like isoform X2 [Vigna unguiculata]
MSWYSSCYHWQSVESIEEETMQIRTESIQIKTTELESESDSEAAAIWNEIEASESFLVCSMYQEAASAASSILERLRHASLATPDMLESTAMVLLQALIHLPRNQHILDQLRLHFISVKAIPPRVLLTGACFQIAQGSGLGVQEFVEDFLNGWSLEDARYCAVIKETNVEDGSIEERHIILEINEYVEVVELYSVTLLATVRKDVDLAISWVENSSLPEENRQGLLRRLYSMHSPESTIVSQPFPQSPTNRNEDYSLKERNMSEGLPQASKTKHLNNESNRSKNALIKLSKQIETCFCCFRGIHLKIGSTKFVITSGKIMLGCLLLFIYYVFRKKQATIKRILRRQAISVKRALVDLWQLAFSYQVNPLAAVQPPSAATRQGQ